MRTSLVSAARVVVILFFFAPLGRLTAETKIPDASAPPAVLVKAALESELDGPSEIRRTLLDQALARDPNFAPARWQSGFVRWDGEWLSIDEVPKRAAADKQLAAYRKMRDAMVDTAENHRALAKWCHKNKLVDEERIHWAKVLEYEPGNTEALAALGLQLYDGRWLTRQQIDGEKQRAGEALRAMQYWRPQMVKWRAAIERGSAKQRDEARDKVHSLSNPEAIPALETIFAINAESKKSIELNLLLIDAVGKMPQPEATRALLRRAILPDSQEVRAAAADQLKKRPMHAYVPLLIAAMPNSMTTRFHVQVLPNGAVVHEHEILLQGGEADIAMSYESVVQPMDAFLATVIAPAALDREMRSAALIEKSVQAGQQPNERLRDRLKFVLQRTTGFDKADDPQLWQKQYEDYYGWRNPAKVKPEYRQYVSNYESYSPVPLPTWYGPPIPDTPFQRPVAYSGLPVPSIHNCFSAGTLVLTITGPLAIEKIRPGDRVLAQHAQTGELWYMSVQERTLRPATRMLKISMGSDTIRATRGHPFWVAGKGWQVAQHLKVGSSLHGLKGPAVVDNIEELPPQEAYNLVVSDFHTYFVGEQCLLVHDNTPLEEGPAIVPGLAADIAVPK